MQVVRIEQGAAAFRLHLDDGGQAAAQRVMLAVGLGHFPVLPTTLTTYRPNWCRTALRTRMRQTT